MRILVTGATGFIGRALVLRLRRDGHQVSAWVRSEERARSLLGGEVTLVPAGGDENALVRALSMGGDQDPLVRALSSADAVVNLAGESIVGGRWSAQRKRLLTESRVGVTRALVAAMARAEPRPRILVSGSAVGFYGDRGDEVLTEESSLGGGFLAQLCDEWEDAARSATALGARVVLVRTGVVLGRDGGALGKLLPSFSLGLGGRLGSGRQWMPWIHLHDLVGLIAFSLERDDIAGAVNGTSPQPATNRVFTTALAEALARPAPLAVPALALRLLLGESASALLGSQRVEPRRLLDAGFRFAFAPLPEALADLVGQSGVEISSVRGSARATIPKSDYLTERRPTFLLSATSLLDVPLDRVFAFFSRPDNLGLMTPAQMKFRITSPPGPLADGSRIDYTLRLGPLSLKWRTRIARWQPDSQFIDAQEAGPYRSWWHEHHFRADGERTWMEDRVYYAPPLGWLGRLAHRLFIAGALRHIFGFRRDAIRLRFGLAPPSGAPG